MDSDVIAGENSNVVLSQLTSEIGQELVSVFTFDAEGRVRETLLYYSVKLQMIVFGHNPFILR